MGETSLDIEYEVVRSDRATKPRIDMKLQGMKVVIPAGMNLEPRELIARKRDWIEKKQEKFQELRSRIPDRTFEVGETFPFQGDEYELVVATPTSIRSNLDLGEHRDIEDGLVGNNRFYLAEQPVDDRGIQAVLEGVYRREARAFIEAIVDEYTEKLDVEFGTLRIKNQKTLWGSCSSKKNLNYNWRLIMAPPEIGRYVVLHELCHLREPNHSSTFWNLLGEFCPEPREKAQWLRDHSVELIFTEDDL